MTTRTRLSPAVFATIVMAPIVVLHAVLLLLGVWSVSGEKIFFIVLIDAVFWLLNFFVWRCGAVRRPDTPETEDAMGATRSRANLVAAVGALLGSAFILSAVSVPSMAVIGWGVGVVCFVVALGSALAMRRSSS